MISVQLLCICCENCNLECSILFSVSSWIRSKNESLLLSIWMNLAISEQFKCLCSFCPSIYMSSWFHVQVWAVIFCYKTDKKISSDPDSTDSNIAALYDFSQNISSARQTLTTWLLNIKNCWVFKCQHIEFWAVYTERQLFLIHLNFSIKFKCFGSNMILFGYLKNLLNFIYFIEIFYIKMRGLPGVTR